MGWDLTHFRNLCSDLGFPDTNHYLESLNWLILKSSYHSHAAKQWHTLFESEKGDVVSIDLFGQEWRRSVAATAAETEALILALRACCDVLAQVLNRVVLKEPMSERKVDVHKVKDRLGKESKDHPIYSKLEDLTTNDKFVYISDFCNRIKHRSFIEHSWFFDMNPEAKIGFGVRFVSFSFNGRIHPEEWTDTIVSSYRKEVVDHVNSIGQTLNIHLEALLDTGRRRRK